MFIRDEDVIEIKIYYRKSKNRYMAYTEKEYKDVKDDEKAKCSVLVLKMKEMTWGLYNQVQDDAMVDSGSGERQFNFRAYKETRLKTLVKEWDAKDKVGKPVPINEISISHLAPSIAESILKAYDEIAFLTEDEEGK